MSSRFVSDDMIALRIGHVRDVVEQRESVQEAADALHVNRRSVSTWIARFRMHGEVGLLPKKPGPKGGEPHNKSSPDQEEYIVMLGKRFPHCGPRELREKLIDHIQAGFCMVYSVSHIPDQTTIFRILKRHQIRYHRKGEWRERRKTLYVMDTPGRELQVDVCFPFGKSRPEVQYDALDDCSRFVQSDVHAEQSVLSSIEFIQNCVLRFPFRIAAIRTDCGGEFAPGFTAFLISIGIEHKKNPPYTPEHNGKVERYHITLWQHIAPMSILSIHDGDIHAYRYELKKFVQWYNYRKTHQGLGMFGMTPAQKISYCLLHANRAGEESFRQQQLCLSSDGKLTLQLYIYATPSHSPRSIRPPT